MRLKDDERCLHCGLHLEAHVYHIGWLVYHCPSPQDTQIYLPRWDVDADDRDTETPAAFARHAPKEERPCP